MPSRARGWSTASGRAELSFGRMLGPLSELRQWLLVRGQQSGVPLLSAFVERTTRAEHYPDWVSGACLLVRRSDAEAVGLLDERYFMYTEDVDFCAAIRQRGRRILFTPAVEIVHLRGRSSGKRAGCHERGVSAQPPGVLRETPPRVGAHPALVPSTAGQTLNSSLWPLASALRPPPSALCPPPSALCPPPSALCPLPSALQVSLACAHRHRRPKAARLRHRHLHPEPPAAAGAARSADRVRRSSAGPTIAASLAALGENFRPSPRRPATIRSPSSSGFRWRCRREGVTLFHAPHYVLPPLVACRSVVTIHDCIHLMFPQYLPNRLRARLRAGVDRAGGAPGDARADGVGELEARHPAVRRRRRRRRSTSSTTRTTSGSAIEPREEDVVRVRERYQLHDEFVLYAGNVKPHKNLERLIDAFHLVRKRGLDHLKLVLIGDEISKYAALRRAVHRHQLHKYVRFLGYLPEETLAVHVPAGRRVRVSVALRGVRPAAARSDGERHAGRHVERVVAAGGGRRRGACWSIRTIPSAIADGIDRVLTDERCARELRAQGARARAAVLVGAVGAPRARDLRRRSLDTPRHDPRRRARPRLADRHARRREGARGAVRAISRTPSSSRCVHVRGSVSPAIERPADPHLVRCSTCRASGATTGTTCRCSRRPIEQFDFDGFDLVVSMQPLRAPSRSCTRPGACTSATA